MADLKIGEEIFNVVVNGAEDAPALLISNSLGADLHMWDALAPVLESHFRVIRYDSRGHGQSVVSDSAYSFDQLGADALGVLDALGVKKAHFLGLSMGGGVGQWLLINAPGRFERAVLADTAAKFEDPDDWNKRIRMATENGVESLSDGFMDSWFTKSYQEAEPDAVARVRDTFKATPAAGFIGSCAALRDMDLRDEIHTIEAPVLVIVGENDEVTPPDQGALLAERIPGARLVIIGGAHFSHMEDTEAFAAAVVDFLLAPAAAAKSASPSYPRRRPASTEGARPVAAPSAKGAVKKAPKAVKKTPKALKKAGKGPAKKAGKSPAKKAGKSPTKKAMKKAMKKGALKTTKKIASQKATNTKATTKKGATKPSVKKSSRNAKSPATKKPSASTAVKKTTKKTAPKPTKKAVKTVGKPSKGMGARRGVKPRKK